MKLTVKQQKFADNYIKSGNATQSAIDAGYSKSTSRSIGQENLTKPDIKNYIKDKLAKIESHKIMDATEALQLLTSIARGETKETVISSTPFGTTEDEKTADLKTRISAIKEILKRYPGNDKLVEQQVRKLTAEADIAEAKAVQITNDNDNQMDSIDKLLGLIEEGSNDDNQTKNTTE